VSDLTPKQRVARSLSWQEPDRVPIQLYAVPEVVEQLSAHFGGRNPVECLEVDFRGVSAPYRGPIRPPHGAIVRYDMWGTGYIAKDNGRGGIYEEAHVLPLAALETLNDVERYPWPEPDDFDYAGVARACEAVADFAVCTGGAGHPDILNGVSRGRGMERVLIDIATRDPVGLAIIDKRCEVCHEMLRRMLEAAGGGIDLLCLGEDMGNQNGRMFSPRDFEDVFRPRLQRFIDLAHAFGCKAMMHSCGDTHALHEDLIDMGLDVLDAMQPEPPGMNIEAVRTRCRGRMAFCGLISTQRTLPFGSEADCRAEARHRLDVIAPGGGYIFAPSHNIQAGTPLGNILAAYEEALGRPLR